MTVHRVRLIGSLRVKFRMNNLHDQDIRTRSVDGRDWDKGANIYTRRYEVYRVQLHFNLIIVYIYYRLSS